VLAYRGIGSTLFSQFTAGFGGIADHRQRHGACAWGVIAPASAFSSWHCERHRNGWTATGAGAAVGTGLALVARSWLAPSRSRWRRNRSGALVGGARGAAAIAGGAQALTVPEDWVASRVQGARRSSARAPHGYRARRLSTSNWPQRAHASVLRHPVPSQRVTVNGRILHQHLHPMGHDVSDHRAHSTGAHVIGAPVSARSPGRRAG